ncbi:MAG: hypothetical protein P8Y24_12185 [Gammaproteobacteria bacterium]|jgi:hypothetical protein
MRAWSDRYVVSLALATIAAETLSYMLCAADLVAKVITKQKQKKASYDGNNHGKHFCIST